MAHKLPFRNRAHEVSRLEAFSDVIFGFAVTLLVVSLEAPKSYAELMEMMRGFLPFAFCFFVFIDFWFEHHHFFKRYALQDTVVIILNTALLFLVLFYVYPLKFMATLMFGHGAVLREQMPTLFTIYGLGFAAVFAMMAGMYAYAWLKREQLGLNEVERIDTMESIWDNALTGLFGLLSAIFANTALLPFAGLVYFGLCIPKTAVPWYFGAKRSKAESTPQAPGPETPENSPQHA